MGSPRGQEWSPYHLHPYCQPRGSLRPVLSIWFCSRKEATGNQLTCLDPPPQATLALHSAPREGEEASGIRRPGREPRGGRGIPGTSLKRPGAPLAREIDTTHIHTHTHNPMQTQKDPTVYKTHVTGQFNCSSQGPAEALLHTGGTRLKENLTLALPRPFGEKGPARQTLAGPLARLSPAKKGLEALVSSSVPSPAAGQDSDLQVPSPTPQAALC